MKKYFLFFFVCTQSLASDLSINFKNLPLPAFAQATYGQMLSKDYVISGDVLSQNKEVTVSIKKIAPDKLPSVIENILQAHGVEVLQKGDIFYLSSMKVGSVFSATKDLDSNILSPSVPVLEEHKKIESQFFLPKNRKAAFLVDVLNSVFVASKPAVLAGLGLVISSDEDTLPKILKIASEIDLQAPSLKISATFVEVSSGAGDSRGISLVSNFLGSQFSLNIGSTTNNMLRFKAKNFDLILDALGTDSRFKQISSPSGLVGDSEKIVLNFGDSVPTISGSSLDRNGNPIQQIQYQQSGVVLDVLPHVLNNGKIELTIDGQVSSFVPTKTGVSSSPTLVKRQVQTTLSLEDGEVLLIGGLSNSRSSNNKSSVSFLPDFLSMKSFDESKSDLVLLISASVVK